MHHEVAINDQLSKTYKKNMLKLKIIQKIYMLKISRISQPSNQVRAGWTTNVFVYGLPDFVTLVRVYTTRGDLRPP
jgi:hypothetical protein